MVGWQNLYSDQTNLGSNQEGMEGELDRSGWVNCDSCYKWRRMKSIPPENENWHCKDNPNPAYSKCSIQQEISDKEIDEELSEEKSGAETPPDGEIEKIENGTMLPLSLKEEYTKIPDPDLSVTVWHAKLVPGHNVHQLPSPGLSNVIPEEKSPSLPMMTGKKWVSVRSETASSQPEGVFFLREAGNLYWYRAKMRRDKKPHLSSRKRNVIYYVDCAWKSHEFNKTEYETGPKDGVFVPTSVIGEFILARPGPECVKEPLKPERECKEEAIYPNAPDLKNFFAEGRAAHPRADRLPQAKRQRR